MILKFKHRIALFNMLAVAFIAAIVFALIYVVVYKTSYAHLDNDILIEKEEVFSNLDWYKDSIIINKMPEWDEAEHKKVEVNPTFLQIVDTKGKVIFHSANLLKDQFLFNPNNKKETFYNAEINGQKIRLGQFAIRNESNNIIGQITIAISQQESFIILNNLILVLLISFPIMLVVQFITSSLAASRAIKPVHQLIKTTSVINDANINTRLILPENKDELYDLTTTINELLSRIENSMLQQKQFTSDASHEIRTPLSGIRGTLEVLIRKERDHKIYKEKITEIIQEVDRLDLLLDQLLQLARIESGLLIAKRETITLKPLVDYIVKKIDSSFKKKNIYLQIEIDENTSVTGDKFFIELILENLILNAYKYGKENGNIHIRMNTNSNMLTIEDDGQGIDSSDIPYIFNRFYRTDESRSSMIKGYGLGLSIAKKLADIQHIKLTVESIKNIGSSFQLYFHS